MDLDRFKTNKRFHREQGGLNMSDTYKIVRLCADEESPDHLRVIATGLTLEDAQAHCNDPSTKGTDSNGNLWFDGYEKE